MQVPGEGYNFNGGAVIKFTEPPKIGDTIKIHIGELISFDKLKEINDLKEITKYLREKTYSLDPDNRF